MKKNRQRDKEIKSEGGLARAMERKRREGGRKRDMREHSNQYLCCVRLYLSAVACLVLLLYYYFSVCLLLNTQSGSGREPGCGRHFRLLFSPILPPLIPSFLSALAILPSSTKPLQKAFGERTDRRFMHFQVHTT